MKQKTKKQLEHEIVELKAQLAHTYHFASIKIKKLDEARLMGSGVLVKLHYLGGKEACLPFVIKDGFSEGTITALLEDVKKSYQLSTMYKP